MNMPGEKTILRDATVADLTAINDIYNHYVRNCTCAWEDDPTTLPQRREWLDSHGSKYPIIVVQLCDELIGWGSLSPFHRRSGYRFTVEDSIYIRPDAQGRGIGKTILAELIRRAKELGYHSILALISADQKPSLALHEKFGFVRCAYLPQVGFKFQQWLDVVYMQKML
jgi:phosphinothricin acetyltransferase